jgi:hypothetical protein
MSYEDIEEVRATRAVKDAATAKEKGKRGRKAKDTVPAAEGPPWAKETLVGRVKI